jgi:hypothetical protein
VGIPGSSQAQNAGPSQAQKALKIVMVPKFTRTAYFAATEKGGQEAVAELKGKGVAIDFLYTGPSVPNTVEEIRMIDDLVAQKPDAISIAASDADAMVPVAKKAKTSGIKVIIYDGDVADPTARQWFVNQGTFTHSNWRITASTPRETAHRLSTRRFLSDPQERPICRYSMTIDKHTSRGSASSVAHSTCWALHVS